jgi:protein SCO1/2
MKRSGLSDTLLVLALAALVGGGAWVAAHQRDGGTASPPTACDLNAGACSVGLPDGGHVELSISPRPIPTLAPLAISADVSGSALRAVALEFSGVDMDMGSHRAALAASPERATRYIGGTQLPVCSSGQMHWRATLQLDDANGARIAIPFGFDAGDPKKLPATPAAASPRRGSDFTLMSAGGPVSLHDFSDKIVLLYFGYTYCPDVCPTSLTLIAQALKTLPPDERSRVQTIFVSVDPARDTPEKLRDYVAFFDPGMIGVTGSAAGIAATARSFGVYYAAQPADANGRYSVDHSAFTLLIDGDGNIVARLPHATMPAEIASRVRAELRKTR